MQITTTQTQKTITVKAFSDESMELQNFTDSPKITIINNQRPDIKLASKVITQRYSGMQTIQEEAILFICLFINLLNQWFNYDLLVSSQIQTSRFWLCLAIEWAVSIYYTYDGFQKFYKVQQIRIQTSQQSDFALPNQFEIIQVMLVLCGPFQFILDIIHFIKFGHLYWVSMFLRSLKSITSNYQAKLLDVIIHVNKEDIKFSFIKSIPLFFSTMIIFFIFSYLFTIFYSDSSSIYFNNIGNSAFTLLQCLTFDGWGDITRRLYGHSGRLIIVFMFIFITIIAFFFFYLIQAFQIDVLILKASIQSNQIKLDRQLTYISANTQILLKQSNLFQELLVNLYYKRIVLVIAFIQIIYSNFQEDLSYADDYYFKLFNILASILYFIHYILISTLDDNYIQPTHDKHIYSKCQMMFHVLAGPFAFTLIMYEITYLQYLRFGPALLLFKLFTNQTIRDISQISKKIIPQSMAPYLCMLGLTFLIAFIMSYFEPNHIELWFDDYAYSILTYFQVITLDDWAGGLAQNLINQNMYFSFIIVFIFMIITNYILIPAFIAQTCEIFSYILGASFVLKLKKENKQITFFSHQFKSTMESVEQDYEINYNESSINQNVKAVIVKLLQNKATIFGTLRPPKLLKDIFKSIIKTEKTIQHQIKNLTLQEGQLLDVLQTVEQTNKKSEIYIKFKDHFILVDDQNIKYLFKNVNFPNR